jgi:hypothetical protein
MLIVQRRRLLLYPPYVQDYLDRVTAADVAAGNTQGLELGVTDAFNTTLQNLVGDSVLGVSGGVIAQPASTIKAMPFMVGARTLQGCLVPVVGTAPTNFNFVAGDYNRKTGLVGNGSTKYLDSNRAGSADPRDNQHVSTYLTAKDTLAGAYVGARNLANADGSTQLIARTGNVDADFTFVSQGGGFLRTGSTNRVGFVGLSRSTSASFVHRLNQSSATATAASQTPATLNYFVFNRSGTNLFSDARLAYYSIGESLDLALLDARVTALINAIAAAIP